MNRYIKILIINICVFTGLLLALNLLAILTYQGYQLTKIFDASKVNDDRPLLPNYQNIEWATQHFQEFGNLKTEYRSYYGWRREPFDGATIQIDQQGIRESVQHSSVSDSSKLVSFLGGSTMWGTGSNNANTIPSLFSLLGDGSFQAINLGESGYNSFQSYLFLKSQILKGLKPDIIVSYDGANDGSSILRFENNSFSHIRDNQIRTILKNNGEQQIEERTLSINHFFVEPLRVFLKKAKNKFQSPLIEESLISDVEPEQLEKQIHQAAIALLEGWLSTKQLAQSIDARFVAILQPLAYIGDPKIDHLDLSEENIYNPPQPYRKLYPLVRKLIRDNPRYQPLSENFLDYTDAFDKNEYIYVDYCHVTPNGNRIIAERIHNYVTQTHAGK